MTLAVRCSSFHLCTPTARTEGCSAAPFAAGVPEGVGVSCAPISTDGEHKTTPQKPTKKNKHRLGRCCFIGTLRSLSFGHMYFPDSLSKQPRMKRKFPPLQR